jgi:hypothetical protein
MSPLAFFIAATVVALIQWLRLRDPRLLALLGMFLLLAIGHSHDDDWYAARPWHILGCLAGLALLYLLSPRYPRPS